MFGYVIPYKPELKIKEYDIFRAYYCGLCREIGKKSIVSRLALTYDMAFLGLLLSSAYGDREEVEKKLCGFKMKKVISVCRNPYLEYAADMNIILSSRKLMDNYLDSRNPIYYMVSRILRERKMSEDAGEKINKIDFYLRRLRELEKNRCDSLDETGDCFAEITAEIFSLSQDDKGKILRQLGYNLGKWIYTIDAYDDIEKDIKEKNYNPCLLRFKYSGNNPLKFKESIKDNIQFTLIRCLNEISKAFELLELKRNRGIIENIIYIGLERKTTNIMERGCKDEKSL